MKKVIQALLTITLFSTLVGCGSTQEKPQLPDVKEVYTATLEKQNEATSLDVDMNMDIKMSVAEEAMTMKMLTELQMLNMDGENLQMAMKDSISSPELQETETSEIEMFVYYLDGYYYMDMMEMKLKYPIPFDEIRGQVTSSTDMYNYDTDALTDLSIQEVRDNYEIQFSLNEEEINSLIQQSLAQSGIGEMTFEMVASNVSGTMLVSKDYDLLKQYLSMNVDLSVEGQVMNMEMQMEMIVNGVNDEVQITFPNLEEYMEIDPSLLQ